MTDEKPILLARGYIDQTVVEDIKLAVEVAEKIVAKVVVNENYID